MDGVLAEMLREAERAVDQQLKVLEELDDKSEQLLAVALATLGSGLALVTFASGREALLLDPSFRGLVGLAIVSNLCALLAVLRGYVGAGQGRERFAGPSPRWLKEKANLSDWTMERHQVTVIGGFADWFDHNAALMDAQRRTHRLGVLVLAVAVLLYAWAGIYVLG